MKSIVFDAGPVISLAINGLLWILEPLKKRFKGEYILSKAIKNELVDKPMHTKRFKLEAIKVSHEIQKGTFKIVDNKKIDIMTKELINIANNCYSAHGQPINIVHYGEMSGIAVSILNKSDAIVIDERTTRLLIENPLKLRNILYHNLHTKIKVNHKELKRFQSMIGNLKVIRSVELVTIAYELGILDIYITNTEIPKENLLDSVLWGVKLNGCAVSNRDIERIIKLESKR